MKPGWTRRSRCAFASCATRFIRLGACVEEADGDATLSPTLSQGRGSTARFSLPLGGGPGRGCDGKTGIAGERLVAATKRDLLGQFAEVPRGDAFTLHA